MRGRHGFSALELLVVLAIMGVLIALLLPAVQSAREAARRTACMNNIRQIALAAHNFEGNQGSLPPYFGIYPAVRGSTRRAQGVPSTSNDETKRRIYGSWFVHLMPYLEEKSVWEEITRNIRQSGNNFGRETSRVLVTPATGTWVPGTPGTMTDPGRPGTLETYQVRETVVPPRDWNGYRQEGVYRMVTRTRRVGYVAPTYTGGTSGRWVGGSGPVYGNVTKLSGISAFLDRRYKVLQCPSDQSHLGQGLVAGGEYLGQTRWGSTNYLANWNAFCDTKSRQIPFDPPVKAAFLRDGLSQTILFAEGYAFCDDVPRVAVYNAAWFDCFGVNWHNEPNTYMFQTRPRVGKCSNWRAQSNHPGGLVVAFGDGHAEVIAPSVSRREIKPHENDFGTLRGVNPVLGDTWGVWDRMMLPADSGEEFLPNAVVNVP